MIFPKGHKLQPYFSHPLLSYFLGALSHSCVNVVVKIQLQPPEFLLSFPQMQTISTDREDCDLSTKDNITKEMCTSRNFNWKEISIYLTEMPSVYQVPALGMWCCSWSAEFSGILYDNNQYVDNLGVFNHREGQTHRICVFTFTSTLVVPVLRRLMLQWGMNLQHNYYLIQHNNTQ